MSLDAIEKEAILQRLKFHNGNKTATANSLGIAIRTLDAKLEKYEKEKVQVVDGSYDRRQEREAWTRRFRGKEPIPQKPLMTKGPAEASKPIAEQKPAPAVAIAPPAVDAASKTSPLMKKAK
jgi:hypothetical protein